MIQGLHASLAVFRPFSEVMKVLGKRWSLGRAGPGGTRRVRLEGSPPRQFLLRVVDEPANRSRMHRWHIQLFDAKGAVTFDHPMADAEVILEAQTTEGCMLRLTGRHRPDAEGGQHGMNAYARSLLDQIDGAVNAAARHRSPAPQAR